MHMKSKLLTAALAVALAACQTTSPRAADALSQARGAVNAARADAQAARFASAEVDRAQQELTRAETAWNSDKDVEKTVHFAYLAAQRAEIARTLGAQAGDEDRLKLASAERERIQLEARARATEARTRDVAAAAAVAVASANADARQAQSDADAQRMRAAALERDLQSLQGRQTERGLVITMNDVLFNTGGATLQPGAQQTVTRLAQVLREYPERRVMIEGFTDNTGSDALNMQLSERRADALRQALVNSGVAADRVETRAYGKAYPVADNGTAAGRQQNRRVEIVMSDGNGRFAMR